MSDEPRLPSSEDVIRGIREPRNKTTEDVISRAEKRAERKYVKHFSDMSIEAELRYAHLQGVHDHYRQKRNWSWFLIGAISVMLLFQMILLANVGNGAWDFTGYEWLLPALLVQNLAQVVGLSVWAVKYLFSDISG